MKKIFLLFLALLILIPERSLPAENGENLTSREPAARKKKRLRKKYACASPSIYDKPTIDFTQPCKPEEKLLPFKLRVRGDDFTDQTYCEDAVKLLQMEGAAWIIEAPEGKRTVYNAVSSGQEIPKFHRFSEREIKRCPYAYGVVVPDGEKKGRPICLDPFYSIAGDMGPECGHKPGDVFFFPELVGMRIPKEFQTEGRVKHDGYMVLRDIGYLIKGCNRFDFYSGPMRWKNKKNPFFRLGMYDKTMCLGHEKVTDEKVIAEVLARHMYPDILSSVLPAPAAQPIEPAKALDKTVTPEEKIVPGSEQEDDSPAPVIQETPAPPKKSGIISPLPGPREGVRY